MNENSETTELQEPKENLKNPKRVAAGKRGAEAKKMKAELKRKELEEIKKENIRLKTIDSTEPRDSITKDEVPEITEFTKVPEIKITKNYLPLCVVTGVVGLGLGFYFYKSMKPREVIKTLYVPKKEKEIDPFEF